jgi:hypothetical protein
MAESKPNPILLEKQAMFAKQRARVEKEKPLNAQQQAAFANQLLARLEKNATPIGPARVSMANAGPLPPPERLPHEQEPTRIGGCFSDIADGNEGAHETESETEDATEEATYQEDDEVPFG